ncbi:histidine phosphatase family protein [Ichthyenterobacterium sp. W332]|uniref:Histidine phosphatase family protein n=1 Tax=Microcosmobacter mediterraneus TaxID=3075607 RepID=A0ABU2YL50_9FLAO|nr:histidine phosphatase family protein [Ichthyenterobacterium sp. W332]MDT0558892.1 histidine phosphatase family protein [Ichthyenterobacterium sp. W332]
MKTLVLMRHGKSSWEFDVSDKERPLKNRGIKDTIRVSEHFRTKKIVLNRIISSPANRALSTCKLFVDTVKINPNDIIITEELYDFGGQNVTGYIKTLADSYNNVIIFGHNHAFTTISNIFGNRFIDNLPTAGLVVIDFETDSWKDISKGTTRFTIFPRDLK